MADSSPSEPRIRFRDTVAYSLLKIVFAVYFVFAVTITAYHMRLDYNTAKTQIVERLGLVEKAFEDSLATALFDLDSAQLQSIIEGLHEMQTLVGVKLEATNKDIFVPNAAIGIVEGPEDGVALRYDSDGAVQDASQSDRKLIAHSFVLHQPGTEVEIARGTLYSSSDVVFATVQNSFVRLVLSAMAKTGVLWLLFLWASMGRLSRPLRKFTEDVSSVDPNKQNPKPIKLDRRSNKNDELLVLCNAFNQMRTRIGTYITDLLEEKKTADQARSEAEKANAAKSTFLSSMSHELRTPLNAIMGFSQIMEFDDESPLSESQRENLNEITRASQHLLELVSEVLDLAKIEQGRMDLSINNIAVSDVVAESIQFVVPMAIERGIHIDLSLNKQPIALREFLADRRGVQADRVRLRQVLLNLLSNAVKYNIENGHITVDCSFIEDRMKLSVTDTGPGMSQDQLIQLFTPFNRLGKEGSTVEGTGIGLVVARSIIEHMDGKIGFKSALGKGSTFWIELPEHSDLEEPSCGENDLLDLSPTSPVKKPERENDATVLYIEDNPANLRLVQQTLTKMPRIQMLAAEEPFQGLNLAARHNPDLILLDINLPGIDGFEVLDRLRQDEVTRGTTVIGLSANAMQADIDKAHEAGFDDYLTKPVNLHLLQQTVQAAL